MGTIIYILLILTYLSSILNIDIKVSNLRYGVSTLVINQKSVTLLPRYFGDATTFSISPSLSGAQSSFSVSNGMVTFGPDVPANDYTISVNGPGGSTASYIISVTKGPSTLEPPQDLRVGYDNDLEFPTGTKVYVPLTMKGMATECKSTPDLPTGIELTNKAISGMASNPNTRTEYSIVCKNDGGSTNIIKFKAEVGSINRANGMASYYYRYYGEPDSFPCNEITNPFSTLSVTHELTDIITSPIPQLNSNYNTYFGVHFVGHVNLGAGRYIFGTNVKNGGAFVIINGELVLNDMRSCRSSSGDNVDFISDPFEVTDGYIPIIIGYHTKSGGKGFTIKFAREPEVGTQPQFSDFQVNYYPFETSYFSIPYIIANRGTQITSFFHQQGSGSINSITTDFGVQISTSGFTGTISATGKAAYYEYTYSSTEKGHVIMGAKEPNGPPEFYLAYGGSDNKGVRVLNNEIYAQIGWLVDIIVYPTQVDSYTLSPGAGVVCTAASCTISNQQNVFTFNVAAPSKTITGICKSEWTTANSFDVNYLSSKIGSFKIFCTNSSQISTFQYLSVDTGNTNCGRYSLISSYGTRVLGGRYSTISQNSVSGGLIAPGSYSLLLESTSQCSASYLIDIGSQHFTASTTRSTTAYIRFNVSPYICPTEKGLPSTPVGGIAQGSCSISSQLGSSTYKCLLDGSSPKWVLTSTTCVYPKKSTYFHYGVSSIKVGVSSVLTLTPYYDGTIQQFSISEVPGTTVLTSTTGQLRLVSSFPIAAKNYTITGASTGGSIPAITTTILIEFVQRSTVAPVRNLQVLPTPYFGFVSGLPILAKFQFTSGSADRCVSTPSLPSGMSAEKTGIVGYSDLTSTNAITYSISCINADSTSNPLVFTSPVSATSNLKQGLLGTYWRYTGTATQITCTTQYRPYVTNNIQITTIRVDTTFSHEASDTIWPGLNGYHDDNWGVAWNGYINIDTTSEYTFSLKSVGSSWLQIDEVLVSSNYGCHGMDQLSTDIPLRLDRGYHIITMYYNSPVGEQGFQLYYKIGSEGISTLVPDQKLFYIPNSIVSYNNMRDIFTVKKPIVSPRPVVLGGVCSGYSVNPSFPSGDLTIDSNTGVISGTPQNPLGETEYTISCRIGSESHSAKVIYGIADFTIPTEASIINTVNSNPVTAVSLYPGETIELKIKATGDITRYSSVSNLPTGYSLDTSTGTITGKCTNAINNIMYNFRVHNQAGSVMVPLNITCSTACPPQFENINITFPNGGSIVPGSVSMQVFDSLNKMLISTIGEQFHNYQSFFSCASINTRIKIVGYSVNPGIVRMNIQSRTSVLLSRIILPPLIGGHSDIYEDYSFLVQLPVIEYPKSTYVVSIPEDFDISPTSPNVLSNCVVIPDLPSGLFLDPYSCRISGRPYESKNLGSYMITGSNAAGSSVGTSITITVQDCSDKNQVFFEAYYNTGNTPNLIWWELIDTTGDTVLYSYPYDAVVHIPNTVIRYVGCVSISRPRFKMYHTNSLPWDGASIRFDAVGKTLGTFSKVDTAQFQFEVVVIEVLLSPIRKWKTSATIEDTPEMPWYKKSYSQLSWPESNTGEISFTSGQNVMYLSTAQDQASFSNEVPSYKLVLTHVSGVILYVNGVEYYRRFLPTTINNATFANGAFTRSSPVTLVLPISSLNTTQSNTFYIAAYRRSVDTNPIYRLSLYGTLMDRTIDCLTHTNLELVSQSNNYRTGEDATKAIDGFYDTDWTELLSRTPGSQATATFRFPENYYVWVNNYAFVSSRFSRENQNINPLDMEFRGNYNNQWIVLGDSMASKSINIASNNQLVSWSHFSDVTLFNQVRVYITATFGPESDMSLAEVLFRTCHVKYCKEDSGFIGAPEDSIATAVCPKGYLGDMTRECGIGQNPQWGDINNSTCTVGPPVDFTYPLRTYKFNTYVRIPTGIKPSVVSIYPVTFSASSILPTGLSVDPVSGELYGVPINKSPTRDYTFQAKNSNGAFVSTKIAITVDRRSCPPDGDWPGTEADSFAEILCRSGMTGTRKRRCNDDEIPQWDVADETQCRDDVSKGAKVPVWVIIVGSLLSVIGVAVIITCIYIRWKNSDKRKKGANGNVRLGGAGHNAGGRASGGNATASGRSLRTPAQKSARSVRI